MKADAREALTPAEQSFRDEEWYTKGWNAALDAAAERAYDFIVKQFGTREIAVKVRADLLSLKGER